MDESKKIIKEDINFLEYPNWVLDRKSKEVRWILEKTHGKYEIACVFGLPTHFDKIVLYYLLYQLHNDSEFNTVQIITSRYEIAKHVFAGVKNLGKKHFDRIMDSLKKWKAISIHYEGVFYEGDGYTIRGFSVLDEYVLRKDTKVLLLRFNEGYIKQLQETKFYKLIDFEQYRKLTRSVSARLYEILIKNFKDRDIWVISIKNLAEKLTLEKRSKAKNYYPSDVLAQINPGINEINKKTDLAIHFVYDKNQEVCTFKKMTDTFKPAKKDRTKQDNDDAIKAKAQAQHDQKLAQCLSYFDSLQDDEKNRIINDISRDPFMRFIPEKSAQIFAYLTVNKLWDFAED
jgi:hypothetical protein